MFVVLAGKYAGWLLPPVFYTDLWEDPANNLKMMWAPAESAVANTTSSSGSREVGVMAAGSTSSTTLA
jgi:hypothetical protein